MFWWGVLLGFLSEFSVTVLSQVEVQVLTRLWILLQTQTESGSVGVGCANRLW